MAVIGSAEIVIHAITTGFRKEIEASLASANTSVSKAGENIGKNFSSSVSKSMGGGGKSPFSSFMKEAERARAKFNSLIKVGYFLGPALSGGVSALSDLVAGLFAVGSAVGSAAPALAVLPGLLAAVAQGAITAKLAFGGIGKAVQSLLKPQRGGGGGANNDAAIAEARKRLAKAYQAAAEKMAEANDKVRKAQVALNQAFMEGAEALQQLGFNAEDAAIAEQKAAIELERARESLLRVQDMPPDSRLRREAELAFKEADLNYRQAKDKSNDLAKSQEYAKRTGLEGTREVLGARQDLAEAEADRAKTQRDNAQDIADAQDALQKSMAKTGAAAAGMSDAFKNLSPEAAAFARYIATLAPVFYKLRAAAGKNLFGPLTSAIQNLVDNLVPVLIPILEKTGGVIGQFALAFSRMLTANAGIIDRVFGGANITVLQNLGSAFVNVAESALYILDAVSPLVVQFSGWIKTVTKGWSETLKLSNANGDLTKKFEKAADAAKIIGGMLKSVYDAFKELGKAAAPAGLELIKAFGGAMDKLTAFAKKGNETGELPKKFMAIADNVKAIGGFLGEVIKALFDMAGNPGVKIFFDTIKPIPGIFAEIAKTLGGEKLGKLLGDFFLKFALLIQKFAESGGVENFFKILGKALDIANKIFSNKAIAQVFLFLAAVKGVTIAFGVLGSVGSFALKVLGGNIGKLGGAIGKVNPAALGRKLDDIGVRAIVASDRMKAFKAASSGAGMRTAFTTLTTGAATATTGLGALAGATLAAAAPFLLIAAAIAIVVGIIYMAYQKSEIFRESVSDLVDVVKGAFQDAIDNINKAIQDAAPQFENMSDVLKAIGDVIGTYVVPLLSVYLAGAIGYIGGLIGGLIRILGGLIKIFQAVFYVFQGIWFLIIGQNDKAATAFGKAWEKALNGVKGILAGLATPFINAWNAIAKAWNKQVAGFQIKIPGTSIQWTVPKLPTLNVGIQATKNTGAGAKATTSKTTSRGSITGKPVPIKAAKGGVFYPQPGGIIANVAEAGRPERIEPLDSQGLSKRDRAIIKELAGGGSGGGNTFVVNPSPGMDEIELSHMVARRVGWAQKRGA